MTDPDTTREQRSVESPTAHRAAGGPSTDAVGQGEQVLDRYRLVRAIGKGGHGVVWEAHDERLERPVAVKAIPRGEGSVGSRAEREGRVAARLNHPGIVGLYELGSDDWAIYLVSELVRGRTMSELSAAGALSDRDVCEIGIALCAALEHAHTRGIVHRDVKPQNVIVVAEPAAGAGFAKLTDFGVARVTDEATLTRTGDVVGTLAYMAPEQAAGEDATAAADIYSLALVLYEGWTGTGPDGAVAARLAGRPAAPLRRLRRDLPQDLCRTIDAALDPRPGTRPTLADLAAVLHSTVEGLSERGGLVEPGTRSRFGIPSAAVPARPVRPLPRWLLRVAAGAAAGGLAVAALEGVAEAPAAVPPVALGAVAWALVGLLPRIGWLVTAAALLAWLASPGVGLQGTALVVALAIAPTPLLLPRAGLLWSVPALAPLLGAIALAPAFVAVAGLTVTPWRRAGLALAGFAWLVGTELVTGRTLLFGVAEGVESPGAWELSPLAAARDAVYPTVSSPALLPAAAWAVLALALGLLVRGRSPAVAVAGAVAWAIAAVAAHEWLADLLAGTVADSSPRGAVAAVLLAATGAALLSLALRRGRFDSPPVP